MPRLAQLLLFFLAFTACSPAQDLTSQQVMAIRKTQLLLVTKPQEGYAMARQMAQSPDESFRLCGAYYVANYHYNQSDYGLAKKQLIRLLGLLQQKEQTEGNRYAGLKGMCLNKLFYLHKNLGEYGLALHYLEKYKSGLPDDHFTEQYGMAKIALGEYATGIAMLKKGLTTSHHLQLGPGETKAMNDKLFADRYNTIGEAYQRYYIDTDRTAYIDSAESYFEKAAVLMTQNGLAVEYTQVLLYMRRAKNAALRRQYGLALRLYRAGRNYKAFQSNIRTVQLFDLGMADCFYHQKQYDSARVYAQRFVANYARTGISKENLLVAYNLLSKSYDGRGDAQNANRYAQKSLTLITDIEKIRNRSLDFVHNYDLHNIQAESRAILSQKNYFRLSLFGIMGVLALVAGSFYYYFTLQKKKHRRFLALIARLKEPALASEPKPGRLEPHPKPTLDADFVEKTTLGLQKLEAKQAYLNANFKLGFVAKKLGTNTAYLSQYFNQEMQKTFSEYTQELRINHVLQKLKDSPYFRNYTLQAIAEEVGYKDATTFVRVFKKQTGLSPNYYIAELQK